MGRPQSVNEDALTARLAAVFRDVGFEGASLALLSQASGLQKASLYHRFPGGKRQMAEEVLAAALGWLEENVLAPLKRDGPAAARLAVVVESLDGFYSGGNKACLLNMLASPRLQDGPFSPAIKGAFEALIDAFAKLARDVGRPPAAAHACAERVVTMLQGSLVLSRGLGSPDPFRAFLANLPSELLVARTEGDSE